ncbi:FAD-binding oxidoreductase [Actinomycetospora termitidis]|uniref:FAD-binding protein n=1 Tax=Actinomycetospora termitidis TaxID=3053470 RepID=A0ABT7M5L7_9PSEU|nr:FAD-binding protein [Actinomycetospora sp. Odt1-22]MDL5155930.1 FAD-binding protein [Actinomycetospora sp. Odt1-22]
MNTAPTTLVELRDAIRDLPGPVVATGAGTAADWAGTVAADATPVSVAGLSGVITHNPGDMTVAVGAGTPLTDLQDAVGATGQRVAFDAARASRGATVGGLFATADAGPLALGYGSLRDLVIGVTVVLADGTVARAGGHVIKNVAGYDLAKLLHGAHGTFGVLAEIVLRLHPVPPGARTVSVPVADAAELETAGRAVTDTPVEATALEWHDGRLLALLEGTEAGVAGRADRLVELVGRGATVLSPDDAQAAWAAHRAAVDTRPTDRAVLRIGVAPTRLGGVLADLAAEVGATGVTAAPATGVATLTVPAEPAAVDTAHTRVAAAGGTSTLRARPAGVELPAFGPTPSSAVLLRAVAASLDPDHRLGRGRLAPWLPTTTGVPA